MKRILAIDDSPVMLGALTFILENEGYSVIPCTKVKNIESIASEFQPDIIFLDIIMPERNGYEVLRSLKKNNKTKDIPIVFVSSKQEPTDVQWGLRQGANDYITKPFLKEHITSIISNYLSPN